MRTLKTAEVADALELAGTTVQMYGRKGRIPFDVTPGGHRRFDLAEVRAALQSAPPARSIERNTMSDHPNLIKWTQDVMKHDYDAAERFLSITLPATEARARADALREAKICTRRANDILRATNLKPLPLTDPGVLRDLKKVLAGEMLSPVLLSGGDIADGYHRVSLSYALDPFADVPLKIES